MLHRQDSNDAWSHLRGSLFKLTSGQDFGDSNEVQQYVKL